jgi:hypothetical protein
MLSPKSVEDKYEDDASASDVAGQARLWSKLKVSLTSSAEINDASLLLLNQIRAKINSPYGGVSTPGGFVLQHIASLRLNFKFAEKIKDEESSILTHIYSEKNTVGIPGSSFKLRIDSGRVCTEASLIELGLASKFIERRGAFYRLADNSIGLYPGQAIGQGERKSIEYLRGHKELSEALYQAIYKSHDVITEEGVDDELGI